MKHCPKCSSALVNREKYKLVQLQFGQDEIDPSLKAVDESLGTESKYFKQLKVSAKYKEAIYSCDCGYKIESASTTTKNHKYAVKEANDKLCAKIIDDLEANGYKAIHIERCLGLGIGTLKKWKAGNTEDVSLALLKMIRSFPNIIDVADQNFSDSAVQEFMLTQAVKMGIIKINDQTGV